MKFLFIDFTLPYLSQDSTYPIGGWAVELNSWINGLILNGHKVGVLTWKGANEFVNKKINFDFIETYYPDKGIRILKYFYYYIPSLIMKSSQYEPDVIIQACSGVNTGIMAFVAKQIGVPFIYRVANDMDTDLRYKSRLLKYEQIAYNYGLKKADVILCQNKYQYENLKEKFSKKPLHILYNPFFNNHKISLNSFEKRKYIAWLGVFQKQKNLPLLYDIAKKIPKIKIKIAGMSGRTIDKDTSEALNNLKKLNNVEFVGYLHREQVPTFLANAIALLNTSHYEGFSNTYLEAFFSGTPVIAPENADPDNIIKKNLLGFSVENNEFDKLINVIANSKIVFDDMSKKCSKYVVENHNSKTLAKKLIQIVSGI